LEVQSENIGNVFINSGRKIFCKKWNSKPDRNKVSPFCGRCFLFLEVNFYSHSVAIFMIALPNFGSIIQ
jgi:hypothetical protein